jgi:hypothetical protein
MNNPHFNSDQDDFPAELALPARRALANVGIHSLKQLSNMNQAQVKRLHGIGPEALSLLSDALAARGLSFKEDNPE